MRVALLPWAYRKLGRRYPAVFLAVELQAGLIVTAATVGLLSFYYDGTTREFVTVLVIALALTAATIAIGFVRARRQLRPISVWIAGYRDERSTANAWAAAVGLPRSLVGPQLTLPIGGVVLPGCVAAVIALDLAVTAFVPLLVTAMVAVGYGAILHYLTIEAGMRPVLIEINRSVSPRLSTHPATIPLRVRLLATLPMINLVTGFIVAALTAEGNNNLGATVLVAIGVSTTIALELVILLSRSILGPLNDLRAATERVAEGDLDVAVPVTTADEIGELAASFNQMVSGLRDRERVREAFGTYLDKEVAEHILSDGFSELGDEVEISVMFCDVKDFTRFAESADAREVVANLNALFEVVVPVIATHGGHVDKFEGDGVMAVFGAPRPDREHPSKAVEAALEIDRRVNREGEGGPFELGVGINTGKVVVGSVGGGGRLNFGVIGDAVNIASRVEGITRRTGASVLLTAATASRLDDSVGLTEYGLHRLKGISEPIQLFSPTGAEAAGGSEVHRGAVAR